MNRISIEEDDERVTTILTRIDDDEGSPTGCTSEIRVEQGKKETGEIRYFQAAAFGRNFLEFGVEMAQVAVLIRTRRIESTANE